MSDGLEVFLMATCIGQGGRLLSARIEAYLCYKNRVVTGRLWRYDKRWHIGGFNRWLCGELYAEILRRVVNRAEIAEGRSFR